jgi:glutamyl-tRNA(Gln) amidotransferase subunit D
VEKEEISGYRHQALDALRKAGARVGDKVKVEREGEAVEGILMPRTQLGDPNYLVLKLASGYNIGVKVNGRAKVEVVESKARPPGAPPFAPPEEKPDLPLVEVIGTGGTIVSRVEYRTGAVYPALSTEDLYRAVPEISSIARVRARVLFSLLSENVYPPHWEKMAEAVAEALEEGAAGVIVAHGTDTMGYTAAALSFALQDLPAPVILVGSQRSSDRPSSDAALNLMAAVRAAAYGPFAEVGVAMHEWVSDEAVVIHRGTKVRKCHTSRRDAFKTVNASPLARVSDGKLTMLASEGFRPRNPTGKVRVKPRFDPKVALVKFHPGFNPEVIDWYVDRKYRGIILEGTGLGHVARLCYSHLRRALDEGLFVGMTSQCLWGEVRMTVYEVGRELSALGVVPLGDMLPETALVKAMWAFGQVSEKEEVQRLMLTNLAGELSSRILL